MAGKRASSLDACKQLGSDLDWCQCQVVAYVGTKAYVGCTCQLATEKYIEKVLTIVYRKGSYLLSTPRVPEGKAPAVLRRARVEAPMRVT